MSIDITHLMDERLNERDLMTVDGRPMNEAHMNESISEIQRLLQEIAGYLKSGTKTDTRKAVAKLERIAVVASTWALTIQARR